MRERNLTPLHLVYIVHAINMYVSVLTAENVREQIKNLKTTCTSISNIIQIDCEKRNCA